VAAIYAQDAPHIRLNSEEERAASLAAMLAARRCSDVWVFGYGSLIWNPAFKAAERRMARIEGWHRAFCMSIIAGRASPAVPGLMLALDRGGRCQGSAFRVAESDIASELPLLWRREMLCRGAYIPKWMELIGDDGVVFGHGSPQLKPAIPLTANSCQSLNAVQRSDRWETGIRGTFPESAHCSTAMPIVPGACCLSMQQREGLERIPMTRTNAPSSKRSRRCAHGFAPREIIGEGPAVEAG
jgi:hypothetical protein